MGITVNGLDELKKLSGSDLGTSEWIEVTQERIDTFADALHPITVLAPWPW